MPEQPNFLGFAAAQAERTTDENPRPYLTLRNPLEVTGGDQVLPLAGVNPAIRQINIQAIGETINNSVSAFSITRSGESEETSIHQIVSQ